MANFELPSDIWAGAVDIHPSFTTEKWGMNARREGTILSLAGEGDLSSPWLQDSSPGGAAGITDKE